MRDFENHNEKVRRRMEERMKRVEERMQRGVHGQNHVWTGLFLLAIGILALAKSFGADMPPWLFTWQMLLISIGLFIGFRKGFTGGWFVPVIIGTAFLINDFFVLGELRKHIWPLVIILIGLLFVFKPHRKRWRNDWDEKKNAGAPIEEITTPVSEQGPSLDDYIDSTSIFGGTEKTILSKNFKGGDMVNIFGGTELNLSQADIAGTAVLEVTAIFGGATLVIPSHWAVKSEAITIFGGISDKRKNLSGYSETNNKTLILKGTVMFGGIEVKSF